MHNSQVSNEVLSVGVEDHELRLPELFVVGDDIVINITFTNLELRKVSIKLHLQIFELLSINICES